MTEANVTTVATGPTGTIRRVVRAHPMATFIALACAISWATVPFLGMPFGAGPFFAAVIVLSMTEGLPGVKDLFRKIAMWRVNWKWYVVALGLPALAAVAAAYITVALGAPAPSPSKIGAWTEILPLFLFIMIVPALGPWEEPGFRGFALSGLMQGRSVLGAGLIVGVMHVFWHLPIFFSGDIPAADVVYIMTAAVVFAWIVVGSGGSVLLAMLMHASSNAISGEYISPMFTGEAASTLGWVRAGIWLVAATLVIIGAGPGFRRPDTASDRDLRP
jgi:membrane protease YdiL (CAAX protease family)